MDDPSLLSAEVVGRAKVAMLAATHMVALRRAFPNSEPNMPRAVAEMIASDLKDINERIRGNRPHDAPLTWSDLALMLEATMQRCLLLLSQRNDCNDG